MRRGLRLFVDASAIALALLAVGFYGFAIHYGIDEGTADPAAAATLWGHVATATYQALLFPFTLLFWKLSDEAASAEPTRFSMGLVTLGFAGIFIDAWLYGFAGAMGLRKLSDVLPRRTTGRNNAR